ncbi:MAG TPA: hypothetical protein VHO90_20125, partial [Bacteroidales bacterium]|nr:hypothetical protein [Bacteroidales bacterium]
MNKLRITAAAAAFLLAVLASSCVKEEIDLDNISDKIYWNPKLGLPVAYGNLTLKDLIEEIDSEQLIKEDENKFLTLIYSDTVLSTNAGSILTFSNQSFGESMLAAQYNLPPAPSEATITMSRNNDYPFSLSHGEVIDKINLKTGTMVINMSSTFRHTGTLKITVPKLVKNNKSFETIININKADGTFTTTQNLDIAGYELQMDHPNETDNLIRFEYLATLVNSGAGIIAGDNVTISVGLNNLSFSSVYGYIGHRQLLNTLSQFSIPFFKNVSSPNLALKSPSLKLRTTNSFGLPASVELYNVEAVNDKDSKSTPVTFSAG